MLNKAREEFGFMSDISGVTVDKPSKLRGDRVDLLLFEESGSNPNLLTTYIQSRALVEILGNKFGIRVIFGTGRFNFITHLFILNILIIFAID